MKLYLIAIALGFLVTALVGLFGGWLPPPKKLSVKIRAIIFSLCTVLSVVLGVLAAVLPNSSGVSQSTQSGLPTGSAEQTPGQQDALSNMIAALEPKSLIVTLDQSAGFPILYSSHLDGTNRKRLWDVGNGTRVGVAPSNDLFVAGMLTSSGLGQFTLAGDQIRVLTHPPGPLYQDDSLAVSHKTGNVYFTRTFTKMIDSSSGTVQPYSLTWFNLSDPTLQHNLVGDEDFRNVAVDEAGDKLAGECSHGIPTGATALCVLDLKTNHRTVITFEHVGAYHPALSADGSLLAYESPLNNPYGDWEVYVYDLKTKETTEVTRLPGQNDQAAWAPGSNACLATHNAVTGSETIYISCIVNGRWLSRETGIAGAEPVWLPI